MVITTKNADPIELEVPGGQWKMRDHANKVVCD